ncbi:MAG: DUF928 domain-containing protein [Rhizonema sp. PD37]|nr:DUF928 domain-containing protein [Rhizonema sp. PD37]
MIKLLFPHLSLTLIFTLTLGFYPIVKVVPQPIKITEDGVTSKQQQKQEPKTPTLTNAPEKSGLISKIIHFILPPKGAPGQRSYAAARADCPATKIPMTALVPPTNIGLTISERPTFWFYIPYQSISTKPVEFLLLNDQKNVVYKKTYPLTSTPGIISITLPQNAPILENGKKYNWVLSFICDPENRLKDTFVKGYIEKIPINFNLKSLLDVANTPTERVSVFAENGVWYDALTLLAEERRMKPKDASIGKDWQDLLESPKVELQEFVSEPIVPCYQFTQ